jgi:hypothetical protein
MEERVGPAEEQVFRLELGTFEGPLDLLLHLIQGHELDILDLPIAFITEKYLEYLALMQELALDVVSEYLVMAATLAHIKSKMLCRRRPPGRTTIRSRTRSIRARSWCGACSSTRSTRRPPRTWPAAASPVATCSRAARPPRRPRATRRWAA